MALDLGQIIKAMIDAAKGTFEEDWPEAKKFFEAESRKFAQNLADIAEWQVKGEITEEDAKYLIGLHKRSMKMVLTASKGISLVMAERAINAALGAIRGIVESALGGWKLF